MTWDVEVSSGAVKDLRRMPPDRRSRIARAIDGMEADPLAGDVKPLKGRRWEGRFRKRVGDYRIIFSLDRAVHRVAISAILLRSETTYR